MTALRHFNFLDKVCINIDQALRTISNNAPTTGGKYPAKEVAELELTVEERKHSAGLMRVNHAGEIAAQALYHGHASVAKSAAIEAQMLKAALEEGDHLAWCQMRIAELDSHTSYLAPFWYLGSFCIGMVAGMVGDKWSLGFVAETERQVIKHIEKHLQLLPEKDARSYSILQQMEKDETKHRRAAQDAGGSILPTYVQKVMTYTAKIMVKTAYWI